jgi:hypothetical protein
MASFAGYSVPRVHQENGIHTSPLFPEPDFSTEIAFRAGRDLVTGREPPGQSQRASVPSAPGAEGISCYISFPRTGRKPDVTKQKCVNPATIHYVPYLR